MRSLTKCLARVLYHIDPDDLPLKQLLTQPKGHRIRVNTTGSHHTLAPHHTLRDKNAFTDIHVRPQSYHHGNTVSTGDVRKFQNQRTSDSHSTRSTPSLKEDRRTVQPVTRSQPLPRKVTPDVSHETSPSIDDVITDNDDVIVNLHVVDQQPSKDKEISNEAPDVPRGSDTPPNDDKPPNDNLLVHQNPFAYEPKNEPDNNCDNNVAMDANDTIISNDDVSTNSSDNRSSSIGSRPIRRSVSENLSSLRSSPKGETLRSFSPDIALMSQTQASMFTEFIPASCNSPPPDNTLAKDPTGTHLHVYMYIFTYISSMPTQTHPHRHTHTYTGIMWCVIEGDVQISLGPHSNIDYQPSTEGVWSHSNMAIVWQRMLCILGNLSCDYRHLNAIIR